MDLGSGDGRMLILAARAYPIQGVGVELDPVRAVLSRILIRLFAVHRQVLIHCGDFFAPETNLFITEADVVFCYLSTRANRRLAPILSEHLRPGSRVISLTFPFEGWHPIDGSPENLVYQYQMPQKHDANL